MTTKTKHVAAYAVAIFLGLSAIASASPSPSGLSLQLMAANQGTGDTLNNYINDTAMWVTSTTTEATVHVNSGGVGGAFLPNATYAFNYLMRKY